MRKKIIIASIFLLIISIFMCIYGTNQYFYYKKYTINVNYIEIPPSTITKNEAIKQMTIATNISYLGVILLIISIILIFIGYYLKEK